MIYFHSSFYYVRYKILLKCWRLVLSRNRFTFKLFFFAVLFTIGFFLHQILNVFFRTIDEIIFFRYRSVSIKQPVFIFANPRSGTTYLHQLMTNDDRYVYMTLAHAIFPSVSFSKLYKLVSFIDSKTGNPVKWLMKKMEAVFFGGWKDIHPLAFNKAEEDEAIYSLALSSPPVFFVFPFLHLVKENWLLDNESEKVRRYMMNYYENSIKRFMYANGKNKVYLSKNVMSSGRINSLLARFPDAKVIYVARNPYEALPSFISMFGIMYPSLSRRIKNDGAEMQAWAFLGIAFYKHLNEARKNIPENNLSEIRYDDLVAEPTVIIERIYSTLQLDISTEMKAKLAGLEQRNKNYKSKHQYSLEQYGLTKNFIYAELKFVFDQFDFKQ
jgi:omega-hydroxy-beta-dihydromenaquinone-9 sulfotransferase